MAISKKQLLAIHDLKLSGILDTMLPEQFEEYCKTLDTFIETFPAQETELKNFFEAKDYVSFSKILLSIRSALTRIHASELVQDCQKLLASVGTTKHEKSEALLTYFLSSMSMLSIDLQMVLYGKNNQSDEVAPPKSPPAGIDKQYYETYRPRSILAVDDVSIFLNGLKLVLQKTDYKFVGVSSGEAALKYLLNHTPDLFILDIEMPGMDGYELAEKIRARGQTAPIIFLTGNSSKTYVLKAIQAGAADFIVKPINSEHVLEKIEKFIR